MRKNILFLFIAIFAVNGFSVEQTASQMLGTDDLHISAKEMKSFQAVPGEHILAFKNNFELILGDNHLKSSESIIWLKTYTTDYHGITKVEHKVKVYLQGNVSIDQGKGAKTNSVDVAPSKLSGVESMVVEFDVAGEIFATADTQTVEDVRASELYHNALVATGQIKLVPAAPASPNETPSARTLPTEAAAVDSNTVPTESEAETESSDKTTTETTTTSETPPTAEAKTSAAETAAPPLKVKKAAKSKSSVAVSGDNGKKSGKSEKAVAAKSPKLRTVKKPGMLAGLFGGPEIPTQAAPKPPEVKFKYPVNISSLSTEPVKFTSQTLDGSSIATIQNRFYLWQKKDEQGGLLEFQADAAVIFYENSGKPEHSDANDVNDIAPGNAIKAAYFFGNVVMTEGLRTIRSDEAYYDFNAKQGLAVNAVMRTYEPDRGIPIYLKAGRLKQLSENKFKGENIVLTNSEFYVPRIAMTASEIIVTDTTSVDAQAGKTGANSYDAELKNVKLKLDNRTVFYWPKFRTSLESSAMPIRRVSLGSDSDWGTMVETEWYLARVLGLKEAKGVDSSLMVDYYSKRGMGVGAKIEYEKPNSFGNISGYIINDSGKDDLSRNRENIEPPNTLRGNFKFQHRQFLPYNWQLTLETSYISDENFIESFKRNEFMTGKEEETLVQLRRIKDNWAFAVMGKWRINDFADQLEELPSAQYHLKGQSLFNDKFTLYHDSSVGSFRQRIGDNHTTNVSQERFMEAESRTELDLPLKVGSGKVVPFVAGTFGYDDRSGFARDAVTSVNRNAYGSTEVFIGQIGTRASTQYWKTYRNIHSEFWDVNGIRHIVKPYGNVGLFGVSDSSVEQKDYINLGVLQRLQTKRGIGEKQRTVDWMRLDTSVTFVTDDEKSIRRPDKFLWNNSFTPMSVMSAPEIFNGDMPAHRTFELYGPQRDSFNADYIWRISDTFAFLSDMNYDLQDNAIEQFNVGFSKLCLPNLSYYVGARYLRSTDIEGEKGSNAATFAITYKLSPRYTIVLAHQYDFDYKQRISTQMSLIRRYHRLYYGITFTRDETLDSESIVLNIWPEGGSNLGLGSSRNTDVEPPGSN
ncbi:MAG: hypothetical protein WC770_05765 [Phycisphaerae bacterium]|jgi:hypothetical protein